MTYKLWRARGVWVNGMQACHLDQGFLGQLRVAQKANGEEMITNASLHIFPYQS